MIIQQCQKTCVRRECVLPVGMMRMSHIFLYKDETEKKRNENGDCDKGIVEAAGLCIELFGHSQVFRECWMLCENTIEDAKRGIWSWNHFDMDKGKNCWVGVGWIQFTCLSRHMVDFMFVFLQTCFVSKLLLSINNFLAAFLKFCLHVFLSYKNISIEDHAIFMIWFRSI